MLFAFFGGIGPTEMLVVGVVAVLLFGSRLPSVARSAGKSLTEFRRGMQDLQDEFRDAMNETERAADGPVAPQLRPPTDAFEGDEEIDAADVDPDDGGDSEGAKAVEEDPASAPHGSDAEEEADAALAGGYPEAVKPPFGE